MFALKPLALLTLAALATGCAAAPSLATPFAPGLQAQVARAPQGTLKLERFTSGAEGFDTHSFWVDTGREVIAFDAQFTPALAQAFIASIRAKTRSPITHLVVTHPNPDKFNGATAFQAIGAKVVASHATAQGMPRVHAYKKAYFVGAGMFTPDGYPKLPQVDLAFDRELSLAGGAVRLRRLAHAGVASTQTVAYVPAAQALVVGDLVHHQGHAWLEGGIVGGKPQADVGAWVRALAELKAYPAATVVYGGRGAAAPLGQAVASQGDYLLKAQAVVRAYLAELGPKLGELDGAGAQAHHAAIAKRIEAAFPEHALAYLTGYSIYGLVAAERRTQQGPAR